jgi:DNA-binding PadR family transcriptional regulator
LILKVLLESTSPMHGPKIEKAVRKAGGTEPAAFNRCLSELVKDGEVRVAARERVAWAEEFRYYAVRAKNA